MIKKKSRFSKYYWIIIYFLLSIGKIQDTEINFIFLFKTSFLIVYFEYNCCQGEELNFCKYNLFLFHYECDMKAF